jgi:hypothetical protein
MAAAASGPGEYQVSYFDRIVDMRQVAGADDCDLEGRVGEGPGDTSV